MVDSIRLEILETIINRLKYYLPESFLVSKDFNEVVESTDENSLLCKLDSSQVQTTLIDNTSYEMGTTITVEGIFRSDDPSADFERAKADRVQLVVDALTQWKYMTDSDANFGKLEIEGVNLTDTNNKEWETISGLYEGYSLKFSIKHMSYRNLVDSAVLWLDSSDINTIIKSSGNQVSIWKDKSISQNDAIQETELNQPLYQTSIINDKSALYFKYSTPSFLVLKYSLQYDNFEIFTIVKTGAGLQAYMGILATWLFSSYPKGTNFVISDTTKLATDIGDGVDEGGVRVQEEASITANSSYLFSYFYDDSLPKTEIFKNGNSLKTDTSQKIIYNSTTKSKIGKFYSNEPDTTWNDNCWEGHIAEIIVFKKVLSEPEREQIVSYLKDKWNIS